MTSQQQGDMKGYNSSTALHPGAVTHHPWPSVVVIWVPGSPWWLYPIVPQKDGLHPQCHHATKALSDPNDRALPAPGAQALTFPSISPPASLGCLP